MLRTLTRKLCPLMSLAIVTVGCGKKIQEPKAEPTRQSHNQEISSIYKLVLNGSEASYKNYTLPKSAQFEIPKLINVVEGLSEGKKIEIAFDVDEFDSNDFHFKCSYVSSPSQVTFMVLSGCEDYDGYRFDVDQQIFPQRKGSILQIRFAGSTGKDLSVEAVFGMTWI